MPRVCVFRWFVLCAISVLTAAAQLELTAERLEALRKRFPQADTNRDGVLSEPEAKAYEEGMRGGAGRGDSTSAPNQAAAGSVAKIGAPTRANVSYGRDARNVLDFWAASSDRRTPVVVYIHGGGFVSGDKSGIRNDRIIQQCLDAGVSFVAINYRYMFAAVPLPAVLRDSARAVQLIRANAEAWNVEKTRVAAYGSSAGAGTALWLAFHDDLADPQSEDRVLRESTRLVCAGAIQT